MDDCDQLEIRFIPSEESEVTAMREAFEHCNMLNPCENNEDEESDSEGGELFTKEYFDRIDKNWLIVSSIRKL